MKQPSTILHSPSSNPLPELTDKAGAIARADTGDKLPAPALLSDPELLDAMARDNAQIAADFIWAGNRAAAREHLAQAANQLNQADAAAGQPTINV